MDDGTMLQVINPVDEQTCQEQIVEHVPMDREQAERVAQIFKAVSDPTRLQILSMILASPAGEACVCDLTKPLKLTQPTISHHLKILVDAGLLTRDKRGSWAWYGVVPERLSAIRSFLA